MCSSSAAIWRTIAVYSMVLSLAMSILSAFSIVIYECYFPDLLEYEPTNEYMVFIAYFYNPQCVFPSSAEYIVLNSEPGHRTWCWSIAYLTLNIAWFLSSLQLYAVPKYWEGKAGTCLTIPWILATFLVLAVDVAACVVYSSDLENFQSLESFIKSMNLVMRSLNPIFPEDYFPLMTVIMLVVFSKAIIFWFINLICFIAICVLLVKVGKPEDGTNIRLETRSAPLDFYYPSATTNPAFLDDNSEIVQRSSAYERSLDNNNDQNEQNNEARWRMDMQQQLLLQQQQQDQQLRQDDRNVHSPIDSLDGWSVYTGSPISILKTPQKARGVRYTPQTFSSHAPWTYLPPDQDYSRPPVNSTDLYQNRKPNYYHNHQY